MFCGVGSLRCFPGPQNTQLLLFQWSLLVCWGFRPTRLIWFFADFFGLMLFACVFLLIVFFSMYLSPSVFWSELVFIFSLFFWWLRRWLQLCFVVFILGASVGRILLSGRVVYNSNNVAACPLPPLLFVCPGCRWYPWCFGSLFG